MDRSANSDPFVSMRSHINVDYDIQNVILKSVLQIEDLGVSFVVHSPHWRNYNEVPANARLQSNVKVIHITSMN